MGGLAAFYSVFGNSGSVFGVEELVCAGVYTCDRFAHFLFRFAAGAGKNNPTLNLKAVYGIND